MDTTMTHALNILLVEDNRFDRQALERLLEQYERFVHAHASDIESAISRLGERPFDCILLDWHLPDGNGSELLEHIAQVYPWMPVVVLTGDENVSDKALATGAQDFMVKDRFNASELERCIADAIEQKKNENTLELAIYNDRIRSRRAVDDWKFRGPRRKTQAGVARPGRLRARSVISRSPGRNTSADPGAVSSACNTRSPTACSNRCLPTGRSSQWGVTGKLRPSLRITGASSMATRGPQSRVADITTTLRSGRASRMISASMASATSIIAKRFVMVIPPEVPSSIAQGHSPGAPDVPDLGRVLRPA